MRRQRRTKAQWQHIFTAQQSSGLAPSEYCVKNSIHLQTFYARRCEMNKRAAQQTGKLIKVSLPQTQPLLMTPPLTVVYRGVTLNVGQTVEAKWLANLMKALTS
tara:strand:- start:6326 stop:6637 length:312 start_codon:yes stop_codon:yes gene_type:complete